MLVSISKDNILRFFVSGFHSLGSISGSSKNLKLESYTPEEFKHHCSYKNIPGYWLDFMKNDTARASDYLEAYFEQTGMEQSEIRNFKLDLVF